MARIQRERLGRVLDRQAMGDQLAQFLPVGEVEFACPSQVITPIGGDDGD